ncbi:MAG: NAD(P)-binding domain-containing protein [Deltaproteobacteria bacterium]|nr:NAD(P)-binding domain-containing protein [Deltaproteobacteria bacterium]
MAMKSIGIVGCGTIGKALLKAVEAGRLAVHVAGVTSRNEKSARAFLATLREPPPYLDRKELIAKSDLVIEAAGQAVVPALAEEVFDAGRELMVISVGALLDHPEIMGKSRETGCRLFVPSGAIAGLDGIKAASVGQISHVTITTRKRQRARGLSGLPRQRQCLRGREPGRNRGRQDPHPGPGGAGTQAQLPRYRSRGGVRSIGRPGRKCPERKSAHRTIDRPLDHPLRPGRYRPRAHRHLR